MSERRIFKTRAFDRRAKGLRVSDERLYEALDRADRGLFDGELGGGLVKLRVGRPGEGRSGGYRFIVAYREGTHVFFLLVYAKNDQANLALDDLEDQKALARRLRALEEDELERAVLRKELLEMINLPDPENP